ncbi:MAG: alpha/beta fold hydrolase, partial [Opitutaceae bacterium]
ERGYHKEKVNFKVKMGWKVQPAKGTIVLLHGVTMRKETMMLWALYLSGAGYRTVLVDLRGHGGSGGEFITYGFKEKTDLIAVLDALDKQGLAKGKVGVLGISYGATMGLHWAASDPRVGAVVAIEPFADAKRAITDFVGQVGWPANLLSAGRIKAVIDQAPREAGFTWNEVNVYEAVEKIRHPILFFHGTHDRLLPVWHSAELKDYALPGSRLVICVDDDHLTLPKRLEPYATEVLAWFDAQLGPGQNASTTK